MQNTLAFLVQKLLEKNNVQFDRKELAVQIKSYPSFPSIHAISAVLDHFGIENIAVRVPINQNILPELPECFIAQLADTSGKADLAVVIRKNKNYQIITSENKRWPLTPKKLAKVLTGIVLAVNNENEENKRNQTHKFRFVKYALFALALLIIVSHPRFFN